MSELQHRIHNDHANTLRLLTLIDRQTEIIEQGGRPDWDIVRGVVDYLLTYPELRHHPLEDLVLARLQSRAPAMTEPFSCLPAEHRELSQKLRHVAAATQSLLQDTVGVKSEYVGLLRDLSATQRDHLRREESGFLPLAQKVLNSQDWQELDKQAPQVADPLQDPADRRFQALRWQLAKWDTEDREARRGEPSQQR